MSSGAPLAALRVSWLDVFTTRPGHGNPLAVIPDAGALAGSQMQALARELGLSESVFVTEAGRRLRIFTPRAELPLAGHPVVGAALELTRLGRIPERGEITFETGAGEIVVELGGGVAKMTQSAFELRARPARERLAALIGVDVTLLGPGEPAICSTTGIRQAFVRVHDRSALAAAAPEVDRLTAYDEADGVCAWCEHEGGLAQRVFAPRLGVPEDPATGSAAGALAALRVFDGGAPGAVEVSQGEELGRPSRIAVEVDGEPGAPSTVRVGGRAVLVLEGSIGAGVVAELAS